MRWPRFSLWRTRNFSFPVTRFSPAFSSSPCSFMGFAADMKNKQTLKLIIIIFSFLGIKVKRIPLAFPQKPFFIPLIIFVTSLNLLQFYHICTWQAWVLSVRKHPPNSVLQNICQHLRPSIELILFNSSGIGYRLAVFVAVQNKNKTPYKHKTKKTTHREEVFLRWAVHLRNGSLPLWPQRWAAFQFLSLGVPRPSHEI